MGEIVLYCEFLLFCLSAMIQTGVTLHETEIVEMESTSLIAPDLIRLSFSPLPGERLSLNLTRNRNIRNNIPVILSKNNRVTKWDRENAPQYHAFYVDTVQKASLHMEASPRGDGSVKRQYMGMFRLHGQEYHIEPVEATSAGRSKRSFTERGMYSIIPVETDPEDFLPDYIRDDLSRVADYERETLGFFEAQENIDEHGKYHYYVETLFVLDYGTFERMWRMSRIRDAREREDDTISRLKYFSSHVANGVDLRFRTKKKKVPTATLR